MMIFSSYGHENYKDPCSLLFTIDNISTTCHIILVVKSNINVVLQILHLTITTFLQWELNHTHLHNFFPLKRKLGALCVERRPD